MKKALTASTIALSLALATGAAFAQGAGGGSGADGPNTQATQNDKSGTAPVTTGQGSQQIDAKTGKPVGAVKPSDSGMMKKDNMKK